MKSHCASCGKAYKSYKDDFLKCFVCNQSDSHKMINHINRPKIFQHERTKHIDQETKQKIAEYIAESHGTVYKSYRDAPAHIAKKFNIPIDFGAVRSIVNSDYFRKVAFAEE